MSNTNIHNKSASLAACILQYAFIPAAYVLLLIHWDYLLAVADNNLFVSTDEFRTEMLSERGGLWAWMGCYLTQYFYYPWLGAAMLTAIWSLTYFLLVSTFRLKGNHRLLAWVPAFALLVSVTDLGYWLYYIKMPGYWFSYSLSFLAAISIAWIASLLSRFTKANIAWMIFIMAYFTVCRPFPTFQRFTYENHLLSWPFIVAPVAVVLLPVSKLMRLPAFGAWKDCIIRAAALIILSVTAYLLSFRDYNFHAECRMAHAVENCDWEAVIEEAKAAERPTNLMVMYKNIALMHTNRLTDMFKINNCGTRPCTADSLSVSLSHQAGPMLYYQFGQINYAYRWAMENSIGYGPRIKDLKMLARCAIINREFDLAAKYLSIIKGTTFHKRWAKEHEPMLLHADALFNSEEYRYIAPLLSDDTNMLSTDNGLPQKWMLDHFSDIIKANSPKLEDVIMCTSLWTEDEYAFCIHFYNYVQKQPNRQIPELYQQAAMMLCNTESSPITLPEGFPFDPAISSRYNAFRNVYQILAEQGIGRQDIGEKMKGEYGDTYWWYYHFYTDFNIY